MLIYIAEAICGWLKIGYSSSDCLQDGFIPLLWFSQNCNNNTYKHAECFKKENIIFKALDMQQQSIMELMGEQDD